MGRSGAAESAKLKTACALALAVVLGPLSSTGAVGVDGAGAETVPGEGEPSLSAIGEIAPSTLPRAERVPASLRVGFEFEAAGSRVPELNSIALHITQNVTIQTKGLPSCPLSRLFSSYADPATSCRNSLIGHGVVTSEIALSGQAPTMADGKLLAFYSNEEGQPRILADVTTETPPLTYVIPFELGKARGSFGTQLVVHKMRTIFGICVRNGCSQPYRLKGIYSRIANFQLSLHRVYTTRRGETASVVNASCPAPGRTSSEFFTLDKVSVGVGGGLSADSLGRCEVAQQQTKVPAPHAR